MAKLRFPGKALKLNNRKRVKFRCVDDANSDEQRIVQIKSGLLLFNQLFGDSDEEVDEEEFVGFGSRIVSRLIKKKQHILKQFVNSDENVNSVNTSRKSKEKNYDSKESRILPGNNDSNIKDDDSTLSLVNGSVEDGPNKESVILANKTKDEEDDAEKEDSQPGKENCLEKSKDSKKLAKENVERTSKKFVLPSISVRSARIIKPNKRLFSDFTSLCSTNQQLEEIKPGSSEPNNDASQKPVKSKQSDADAESTNTDLEIESDPVCRSITFYTDSITEEFKGQVGRPPKRILRKGEVPSKEELIPTTFTSLSPSKGPKEEKVKEKIEKLLRSPWDSRIRQNAKVSGKEREKDQTSITLPFNSSRISKSILRKARLNLNKQTLQKIRSPASVQRLVPLSEDETAENKCGLCQNISCNTICRYGVSCCEACHLSINFFTENFSSNLDCIGEQGECQMFGLPIEEKCLGCWLSRILVTCAMPSLLHDRLRNYLPPLLREKVPTSLGRSSNVNSAIQGDEFGDGAKGINADAKRNFGSLVDLPGGWKRKNGDEVIVISPSGEKFKSITKLEDYLKRQGISAEASVLFGNLNPKNSLNEEKKLGFKHIKPHGKVNNVVVTTLPGGWTRRIKWRCSGDRFDTYVCSPDGRTFRSRKELSSYFQHIGKIDDLYKYFPVINSDASHANSSDNSEASSTEPVSSPEVSVEENSPHMSESEGEDLQPEAVLDVFKESLSGINESRDYSQKSNDRILENSNNTDISTEKAGCNSKSETLIISDFTNHTFSLDDRNNSNLNKVKENIVLFQDDRPGSSLVIQDLSSKGETTFSSLSDSELDTISGGVNLKKLKKKAHKHKKSKKKSKEKKKYLDDESHNNKGPKSKIKNSVNEELVDSNRECSSSKHKKKKKKKKHKHDKILKELSIGGECKNSIEALTCDVESNSPSLEKKDESITNTCGTQPIYSDNTIGEENVKITCHPNDTWQTLICSSVDTNEESQNKENLVTETDVIPGECINKVLEIPETSEKTEFKKPDSDQSASLLKRNVVMHRTKKITKLSGFTTQPFGNGWGRKIKWNDKGQGKVSYLTSPDGQKIVSSIELMAYFKKAGKTLLDLDYYFPKDLVRELPKEEELPVEISNEEALKRLSPTPTIKEKIQHRKRGRRILYKQPKNKSDRKTLKLLHQMPVKRLNAGLTLPKESVKSTCNKNDSAFVNGESGISNDAGPRVKHVCRSQAQVLGMPRAVFPSPDKKSQRKRKVLLSPKKAKYLSVITPKGRRVLKKTIWCNKCRGCITPNCRKCVHCLDMKKYGGPGTKKKPCVMRKCLNPTRAIKIFEEAGPNLSQMEDSAPEDTKNKKNDSENLSSLETHSLSLNSLDQNSECEFSDLTAESIEDKKTDDAEEIFSSPERSIFVPKMMPKPSIESKDKGDIQAGKECVPGMRVNIDYWQPYDAEEMLISGFPIITSVPLQIDCFCFRCGSAGMEQLLYCIWCCEGVHPFCLEEGEGPENDDDEMFWVCKKCAVCHVCGGLGHYDLHQCSGCRKHYHLECLGPSSHLSCQPSQDGIWVSDVLHLLSLSWPKQAPIVDMTDQCNTDSTKETVTLLEELESLHSLHNFVDSEILAKEETCILPSAMSNSGKWQPLDSSFSHSEKKKSILIESVQIEDTCADLEAEDHICLEDTFQDLEDIVPLDSPQEEEIVTFFRDIDLSSGSLSEQNLRDFVTIEDDEYLCLKYKKILPYQECSIESSLLKIIHMINSELFDYLGYSIYKASPKKDNSKGKKTSDDKIDTTYLEEEEAIDLKSVIQIRRAEVQQAIKELEDFRISEEKRIKELEREKSRKRRLEYLMKENNEKENFKINSKKLKPKKEFNGNQNSGQDDDNENHYFLEYNDHSNGNWQPQSWEEFDALFSNISTVGFGTSVNRASNDELRTLKKKRFIKGKRGRPREQHSPNKRKAKRLRVDQCSVKVTRLELRKWKKEGRRSLNLKKSPLKRLLKRSPMKVYKLKNSLKINKCLGHSTSDPEIIEKEGCSKDQGLKRLGNIELGQEVVPSLQLNDGELKDNSDNISVTFDATSEREKDITNNKQDIKSYSQKLIIESEFSPIEEMKLEPRQSADEMESNGENLYLEELNKRESLLDNSLLREERSSTRPRRIKCGRASELASLRKAMLDDFK